MYYDGKGSVVLDFDNSKAFIYSGMLFFGGRVLGGFSELQGSEFQNSAFQISELQILELLVSELLSSDLLVRNSSGQELQPSQLTSLIAQEAVELADTTKTVGFGIPEFRSFCFSGFGVVHPGFLEFLTSDFRNSKFRSSRFQSFSFGASGSGAPKFGVPNFGIPQVRSSKFSTNEFDCSGAVEFSLSWQTLRKQWFRNF